MISNQILRTLMRRIEIHKRELIVRLIIIVSFRLSYITWEMFFPRKAYVVVLSEFDFEIGYIKGKENRVVHALSKRVHVNHITTMISDGTYL